MNLTLADAIAATDARVLRVNGSVVEGGLHVSHLQRTIQSFVTDSRQVTPGAMFVALPGERVDGHTFVPAAFNSGALVCLVSDPDAAARFVDPDPEHAHRRRQTTKAVPRESVPAGDPLSEGERYLLVVPDTLRALQRLAAEWRLRHRIEVVGVTGSLGKTSTKEIVASVLGYDHSVLKNQGNANNEIGLPLTLLGLRPEHQVAVLEMGMYVTGEIALLASIARPRIGIVTNVLPIHLERTGSIERIARAKSELVAALPADGLAILNGDDPWTRAMAEASGIARSILVGLGEDCGVRADRLESYGLDGISFDLVIDGRRRSLRTSIPGTHHIHAFLAAIAIARELGMGWPEIEAAIASARLDIRQRIIRDRDQMLIIDDSYNAAPNSVRAALALLADSPGSKIAVLGDMLELGASEQEAHRDVGLAAAEVADWLIVRGMRGGWIADAAESAGLPSRRVIRTDSNVDAAMAVESVVGRTPVAANPSTGNRMRTAPKAPEAALWSVLVKGSRGMGMEEIVERIRGEA